MGDTEIIYEPEWQELEGSTAIQGASWWLAERIVKGCDTVRLSWSNSPAGVGYDNLILDVTHAGSDSAVWINRGGSIHLHSRVRESRLAFPGVWQMLTTPAGRQRVLSDVFDRMAITPRSGRPSTPTSIMCRVIAQVMYQAVPQAETWTTWTELLAPDEEVSDDNPLIWVAGRDWRAVAKFVDGWMVLPTGERVDLYGSYRAGATAKQLAGRVDPTAAPHRKFTAHVPKFD